MIHSWKYMRWFQVVGGGLVSFYNGKHHQRSLINYKIHVKNGQIPDHSCQTRERSFPVLFFLFSPPFFHPSLLFSPPCFISSSYIFLSFTLFPLPPLSLSRSRFLSNTLFFYLCLLPLLRLFSPLSFLSSSCTLSSMSSSCSLRYVQTGFPLFLGR